jgi:hypothetical protein
VNVADVQLLLAIAGVMATAARATWSTELQSIISSLKAAQSEPDTPHDTERNDWDRFSTLKPSLSQDGPPIPHAALKRLLHDKVSLNTEHPANVAICGQTVQAVRVKTTPLVTLRPMMTVTCWCCSTSVHVWQVLLKVWRQCSALAATSNTCKAAAAVYGAHTLLACLRDAGILPGTLDSTAPSVLGPAATRMAKDVKQQLLASTLLQQLPALLTDAALQLQVAAGVRAATETQHTSVQDPACSTPSHPASRAENQAVNIISLVLMIHHLMPVFTDSSDVGASCLLPAQHLGLAIWQYLSTVPALQPSQQDGQTTSCSSQPSIVLTEAQLQLSSLAWELSTMSRNAVSAAIESQRSVCTDSQSASPAASQGTGQLAPARRAAGSPQGVSTLHARTADAAVWTRHHMESLCLGIVHMQLALLIKHAQKQEQLQHRASSTAAGVSAEQLRPDSLPQVPAPIQRMLLQLGCSPHAAQWQARLRSVQDAQGTSDTSFSLIEEMLIQAADRCVGMRDLSKRFLLDSTPTDLPRSLLLELQQHLQLHKLLPGVLLQWVASKPSTDSNYSKCCFHAANAAAISGNMYPRVLKDGPDILYQHMTGHSRLQPQLPDPVDVRADSQLTAVVPIPADVLKIQLQLLEQLLNNMLALWRSKYSENRGPSSSKSSVSNASSQHAGPCKVDNDLLRAIFSAGSMTLHQVVMAEPPPAQHPTSTTTDSVKAKTLYSSAASSDAGRLCALLENVSRMELAADQQAAAAAMMAATRGSPASNSTQRWVPDPLPPVHAGVYMRLDKQDGFKDGQLLDPILAHGPGSKSCMQLCSLLTTTLKCSAWDSCCPEALASDAADDSHCALKCKLDVHPAVSAEQNRGAVCGAACAVIEAATAQVPACQSPASGAPSGSSTRNGSSNAASKGAKAILPWLVVLGRCCLQWGHNIKAQVASREAAGMSAADFGLFSAFVLVDLRSGDLAEAEGLQSGQRASVLQNFEAAVAISKSWLSAGSHIAQLAALGYDAEGLLQCLSSADATAKIAVRDELPAVAQPEDVLRQLLQQLQSVGVALTSFAHPSACNNPLCSNPAGPLEAVLVLSKTSRCSACRAARYCGKACQVAHWKQHKHVCERLAAAAAAAAAAGVGVNEV